MLKKVWAFEVDCWSSRANKSYHIQAKQNVLAICRITLKKKARLKGYKNPGPNLSGMRDPKYRSPKKGPKTSQIWVVGFCALYGNQHVNPETTTQLLFTNQRFSLLGQTIYSKIEIFFFHWLKFELFWDPFLELEIWDHLYYTDLDRVLCKL